MKAAIMTAATVVIATVVGSAIPTSGDAEAFQIGVVDVESNADCGHISGGIVQYTNDAVEALLMEALQLAQSDGDPLPDDAVLAATREVYRELTAEGLDASDITHDALGGIAITIGNAAAFAWVSLRNDAPATVRFLGERDGGPPIPVAAGFVKRIAEHVGESHA